MIAMVWVVISLTVAVIIGVVGFSYLSTQGVFYANTAEAEYVFIDCVMRLMPGIIAGIMLAAIMAAAMSTADSQLLVAASAVSNDFYKLVVHKNASDKEIMWVSRGAVLAIAVIAYFIALDPNNSIMNLVSYAWAGLGASFGPAMLFSLFWKRVTLKGTVAGMLTGGILVLIWETLQLEAATGIYSLLPAFILSCVAIVVVSKIDHAPQKEIEELFDRAVNSKA